ncbi:MAG: SRPBCC family protein [Anaerolineae bacterium]
MVKMEHSLVINRPVEEVFAFLTRPENGLQFRSSLVESVQISEGPMSVGTRLREVEQFLGRRIESTIEVTAYEPNKTYGIEAASGPMPFEMKVDFEAVEGGTRLTVTGQAEMAGLFKLAEPVVARMTKRAVESDFANLKDVLEAGAEGGV